MILYRCFAWNERARRDGMDGPLWFPRPYQGEGRHDNSELYGCLYLSDRAVSCVAEQLARFRGQRLTAPLLRPVKTGSGGMSTGIRQEHSRSYL